MFPINLFGQLRQSPIAFGSSLASLRKPSGGGRRRCRPGALAPTAILLSRARGSAISRVIAVASEINARPRSISSRPGRGGPQSFRGEQLHAERLLERCTRVTTRLCIQLQRRARTFFVDDVTR
jgi:hypothetical protein